MHKNIKENVATKLTTQFDNQGAQKVAALKNELTAEKAAQKTDLKKN